MTSSRESGLSRRSYLKAVGASGAAFGVAGCVSTGNGDGGGNGGQGQGTGNGESGTTTIVAGTAPGFPPFEMKNDQNELVGFDVDLLEAVVKQADGYELKNWNEFEFSSLIPALRNDRIDVIAAAMTINEERKQTISFTNPYYNADQSVLVRADGDFSPSQLSDLSGHVVGAQEGTTGAGVVKDELIKKGELKESNFKTYGSYVLAVEDLENGNIDAIVLDKPVAQTFADQRQVEVAFTHQTGERYGFGVRKKDDDLRKALNQGLQAVRQNGTYDELRKKWFASGSGADATAAEGSATGTGTGTAGGEATGTETTTSS